jgi:uncharacterized protein
VNQDKWGFLMDIQDLQAQLQPLPPRGRTAFAALCCERLLLNYQAFQVIEQWGDVSILTSSLDVVWNYVHGADFDKQQVLDLQDACKSVAPDTEEFTSLYAGLALNASSAVYMTLQTLLNGDIQTTVAVAELGFAAIDEYLNRVTDPILMVHGADLRFDEWLANSPMFSAERIMQQENVEFAGSVDTISSDQTEYARSVERTRGIQPFLRGLVKQEDPI